MTFAEFTWQRFVADESLAALVLPEFAWPRTRGNLEALSERLFSRGPVGEALGPDNTFTVIAAPGRAREVEIMARRIRELLERGVFPEHIAIVVRISTSTAICWSRSAAAIGLRSGSVGACRCFMCR